MFYRFICSITVMQMTGNECTTATGNSAALAVEAVEGKQLKILLLALSHQSVYWQSAADKQELGDLRSQCHSAYFSVHSQTNIFSHENFRTPSLFIAKRMCTAIKKSAGGQYESGKTHRHRIRTVVFWVCKSQQLQCVCERLGGSELLSTCKQTYNITHLQQWWYDVYGEYYSRQ